jgi:ABC-type branched-subunit amino acid transport system substrate-binding protein
MTVRTVVISKAVTVALAWIVSSPLACAFAQDVVVAHVGPFTGPLSPNGLANYEGSKACVEEANAAGGVLGRKLRLVREDDKYKPEETVRLLREVAQRDKPISFINLLGSANVSAVLKDRTLDELRVPAVGVTPGADILRTPGSPWMFHVQAGDSAQLKHIVQHLTTIGFRRVAVVFQDIPFGRGGLKLVEELASNSKIDIVGRVAVPSAAEDLKAAAAQLRQANAQVYVMILAPNSGSSLVRDVRGLGDSTPIYGMSYVPVKDIVEKAGNAGATGVGLAQVTPNTYSSTTALVRRFDAAMGRFAPGVERTQLHLIGYVSCRALVEGIKSAGSASPEAVRSALQRQQIDLGGYLLDFAGTNIGSRYVDIGVITREGRLMY